MAKSTFSLLQQKSKVLTLQNLTVTWKAQQSWIRQANEKHNRFIVSSTCGSKGLSLVNSSPGVRIHRPCKWYGCGRKLEGAEEDMIRGYAGYHVIDPFSDIAIGRHRCGWWLALTFDNPNIRTSFWIKGTHGSFVLGKVKMTIVRNFMDLFPMLAASILPQVSCHPQRFPLYERHVLGPSEKKNLFQRPT